MTSSEFASPGRRAAQSRRSRLAILPSPRHWILVPLVLGLAVLVLGFVAKAPAFTGAELTVVQSMSTGHVGWLGVLSLAVEQILGPKGAAVILVVLLGVLWFARRTPVDALAVVSTTGFGWVSSLVFKYSVDRPRPDPALLADPLSTAMDPNSFPSGHVCFAVSLTLALFFLFRHRRWGRWVLVAGMGFSVLVALSRLYLGVHYPTDVVAPFPASVAGVVLWCGLWNRFVAPVVLRLPFVARLESL